jgi:hypothetical protein
VPYVGMLVMVVWIGALIDVICCDEHRVRHLPKPLWLLLVLLVPLIGSVLWLLIGRPLPSGWSTPPRSSFPEYDRPGRHIAQRPDSDEEFLRRCRERADQQRRTARNQQRHRDDTTDDPT